MEYVKLRDVVLSTQYGYTATETSRTEGNYKYLRITDIVPYYVDFDTVPYCQIPDKQVSKYIVNEGDILIARTGATTGYNYVVPKGIIKTVYASYLIRFVVNKEIVLPLFMKYLLKSQAYYGFVNNNIGGSAQPGMNAKVFGRFNIPKYTIERQRKIASILSAYDNLIENNNKRIKLLEQMAESLYKEWFVRFRFPGHENVEMENGLPKGWEIIKAEERYTISIGKTPPRKEPQWFTQGNKDAIQWLSISDMNGTYTSVTNEELTLEAVEKFHMIVVPKETILLSFKLSVGRVTLAANSMCTNEAIAHFRDVSPIEKEYLFLQLKTFEYSRLGNTSAIGNAVNSKIIKSMPLVLPNESVMLSFHNITSSIFAEINSLQQQSQLLIRQRDLLLPRLMSGKLEVRP